MNKRLLILSLAVVTLAVSGCTSSSSESDTSQETSADSDLDAGEAVAEDNAAPSDGDVLADLGEDTDLKPDESLDGQAPDASLGSDAIAEAPLPDAPPVETQTVEATPAETMTESVPEAAPQEDLFGASPVAEAEPVAPKPMASLKKIKEMPYEQGGVLLNTVYLARDGDTVDSVAEKTLKDAGRKKELIKANSFLKRGVKVGDKIYYNSPNRPQDAERMLTYYEDINVPPQTYVTKEGENIRDIAQQLLGSRDSWKELWSTNMQIESKGEQVAGTEIRYWPMGADAGAIPPAPPVETPIAQADPNALPPPPAPGDMPPPPSPEGQPTDMAAAGTIEPPPPPPPPPEPPKPPKMAQKENGGLTILGLGQDETMVVLGSLLVLGGLGAIVAVRKSRARRLSQQTQV